jgi:hypothetical protein
MLALSAVGNVRVLVLSYVSIGRIGMLGLKDEWRMFRGSTNPRRCKTRGLIYSRPVVLLDHRVTDSPNPGRCSTTIAAGQERCPDCKSEILRVPRPLSPRAACMSSLAKPPKVRNKKIRICFANACCPGLLGRGRARTGWLGPPSRGSGSGETGEQSAAPCGKSLFPAYPSLPSPIINDAVRLLAGVPVHPAPDLSQDRVRRRGKAPIPD